MPGEGGQNVPLQAEGSSKCSAADILRQTLPSIMMQDAEYPLAASVWPIRKHTHNLPKGESPMNHFKKQILIISGFLILILAILGILYVNDTSKPETDTISVNENTSAPVSPVTDSSDVPITDSETDRTTEPVTSPPEPYTPVTIAMT